MSDATKPLLRIRANASENVKGIVSCEATAEIVNELIVGPLRPQIVDLKVPIARAIEETLTELHVVLRSKGHKLAVDGGA